MKYFFLFILSFSMLSMNYPAYADDELGVDYDFEEEETIEDTDDEDTDDEDLEEEKEPVSVEVPVRSNFRKGEMASSIASRISKASAIENLMRPEQVFCYRVNNMPEGYTGYTLDGFALMSFCGTLSKEARETIIEQLFSREENISFRVEKCHIKPQLVLRFVRGVDATDILISSPCHSYTVFYAGERVTYNLAPIASSVDYLIGTFNNVATDFVSPALLNQAVPSGTIQNDDQKALVENSRGPMRLWEQKKVQENQKKTGWNKLKFK